MSRKHVPNMYTHTHRGQKITRCDRVSPVCHKFGVRARGCTFHFGSGSLVSSRGCHSGSTGSCRMSYSYKRKAKPEVSKSLKKHYTHCQETFIRIPQRQNMGEGNQLLIKTSPPLFEGIVKAQLLLRTEQNILLLFKLV